MEDKVARNEVDVAQGGLVDRSVVLVEAVRKTIDMRRDVRLAREHTLVQKLLLELQSLLGYIRISVFRVLFDGSSPLCLQLLGAVATS
jgi:hypothetical protein